MNSALVRSKSNLVIETAFRTIAFHINDLPRCFLSTKTYFRHDCFSIVKCVSDVTVGGRVWGCSPQEMFGLNCVKSCNFRQNNHGNALS